MTSTLTTMHVRNVGGTVLEEGNETLEESLVALYQATWNSAHGTDVFVSRVIARDAEDAVPIEVPEAATILQWDVDEVPPNILETVFGSKGILIRDEYEHVLQAIFLKLSEVNGTEFGYHPIEFPKGQLPPFNPFDTLHVRKVGEVTRPGVVVTGTPGIGKSMFLYYVLALRLIAKKTTVLLFDPGYCIIFHANGVFKVGPGKQMSELGRYLPWDTWFLVDANEDVIAPPTQFIRWCRTSPRVVLVAASPRVKRLYFSKDLLISVLWMAPFTLAEFFMARGIQLTEHPVKEKMLAEFFELYGPIAREAFKYSSCTAEHERLTKHALGSCSLDDLHRGASQASEGYFEDGVTHKMLNAFPKDESRDDFYVRIPTKKLADLLVDFLLSHMEREAARICSLFLLHDRTRSVASRLLESFALAKLPRGGQWTILPMTKNPVSARAKNQYWQTNLAGDTHVLRIGHNNKFLEILKGDLQVLPAASFSSVSTSMFPVGSKPTLETGFHIPIQQNIPTLDAYAYDKATGHLVIFKMTCSGEHELKPVGLDWLGVQSVDIVVVTSFDGGNKVYTPRSAAHKLRNAYRLVLLADPNVEV